MKLFGSLSLMLLGLLMFIYGGYDDSPGGQLLGVLILLGGVVGIFKCKQKK